MRGDVCDTDHTCPQFRPLGRAGALQRGEVVVPKPLVIVESPAKAKTIEGFLGRDTVRVIASYGHIRDLPSSAKEVPKSITDREVRRLGIDVNDHFTPVYVIPEKKREYVRALRGEPPDFVILNRRSVPSPSYHG